MTTVEITGWQKGCNTIAAIKAIRFGAGIQLNEALALVNRVLANEKAEVCVPLKTGALNLVDELGKAGMICQVASNVLAVPVAPTAHQ